MAQMIILGQDSICFAKTTWFVREKKRLWDYNEDGLIGNGSKAKVQFEVYANGAGVRLLNVGVTEHVIYDNETISEDD